MKITKSQMISLLVSLLFLSNIASAEYKQYNNTKQDTKQQKMEKRQQKKQDKKEEKKEKMKMKMKQKVKSYSEVILEQAETLKLTDQQLGKILRIQMTNKKARKELLAKPHKSMKKALKELRNPAADDASIRKAARAHTDDFDALAEAELKVRKNINNALTPEQRKKLKSMQLPDEEKMNE